MESDDRASRPASPGARPTAHTLVAYARPEAFAMGTLAILERLGYATVDVDEFRARCERAGQRLVPSLRLVDERRLGEVEEEPGETAVPIVLLTGRHGATGIDPRIVAAVKRPVGLHDLYRVLQQVLEETPRSTPRIGTHLSCTCRRRDREFPTTLLSLSENGALLRTPEDLPLGAEVELRFSLPGGGEVCVGGDAAYQLPPDTGIVFNAVPPDQRGAIQDYIVRALS